MDLTFDQEKTLYSMRIGEMVNLLNPIPFSNLMVHRVPGGWNYIYSIEEKKALSVSVVFVPLPIAPATAE